MIFSIYISIKMRIVKRFDIIDAPINVIIACDDELINFNL